MDMEQLGNFNKALDKYYCREKSNLVHSEKKVCKILDNGKKVDLNNYTIWPSKNRRSLVGNRLAYQTWDHGSNPSSVISNKTKYKKIYPRQLPLSSLLETKL